MDEAIFNPLQPAFGVSEVAEADLGRGVLIHQSLLFMTIFLVLLIPFELAMLRFTGTHCKPIDAALPLALLLAAILSFVWPTPYKYVDVHIANNVLPARLKRWTGEGEVLGYDGWRKMGTFDTSFSEVRRWLPYSGLRTIVGNARILPTSELGGASSNDRLECSIYNGSGYSISELVVNIKVADSDSTNVLTRAYRIFPKTPSALCESLCVGNFGADLGFNYDKDDEWSWSMLGAYGRKKP